MSDQIPNEVKALVEDVIKKENISNYKIEVSDGSNKGEERTGGIKSIRIVGENKTLSLIIKTASKSDALRSEVPIIEIFEREIYAYSVVLPTFQELEAQKGLQPSQFAPKYYKGQMINKCEALVLENLTDAGYKLHENKEGMDDSHVTLVMGQFGRFHACSFALKKQYPEKFGKVAEPLKDVLVTFMKKTNFVDPSCKNALEALDPDTDKAVLVAYKVFTSNLTKFYDEILESVVEPSVILHGDCWTNNMMFKYDDLEVAENPMEIRLLDFQVTKQGSPVFDLVSFFYGCSSKKVVDNEDHYKRVYYDSFSAHLRKLGSDPEKLFPYSVFEEHWRKFARYGLLLAAMTIYAAVTESNEKRNVVDVLEAGESVSNVFGYKISNVDKYNERMRHVILHFAKNNLI